MTVPLRIALAEGGRAPEYQTPGAAGMDLCSAEEVTLAPGARGMVPTGLRIAVPEGYEAQVRARSGLAARYGIALVNSPGTIDADFRGEIQVLLINLGQETVTLRRGERIAQLVLSPVVRARVELVEALDLTERGAGGFGSTGV